MQNTDQKPNLVQKMVKSNKQVTTQEISNQTSEVVWSNQSVSALRVSHLFTTLMLSDKPKMKQRLMVLQHLINLWSQDIDVKIEPLPKNSNKTSNNSK